MMDLTEKQLEHILKKHKNAELFVAKEKIRENAKRSYFDNELKQLKIIADDSIGQTTSNPTFEEYFDVEKSGFATRMNEIHFGRRKKMNAQIILYIVTGEKKYLTALQNEIWRMCDEYMWAAPGELRGHSHTSEGWNGVPHHQHLDLRAAENGFMFAEILHLLGDELEEIVIHRMKKEIERRILSHYQYNKVRFWWEDTDNNWAAVCAGSIGCTAIYSIDDEKRLAACLLRVLNTLEKFMNGYGDDGASVEGVAYWNYGFSNYVFFAQMLKERTEGEIDLLNTQHCKNISLYAQKSRIYEKMAINFGDSGPMITPRMGFMHLLKSVHDEVIVPRSDLLMKFGEDNCYRFAGFIRDYAWFNEDYVTEKNYLTNGDWFELPQIFTTRKGDVFFAAIGGNNGYSHNHNDIGHFLYFIEDVGFFVDFGQGIYCTQYFSSERYSFRAANADGHSLPQFEGYLQKPGENSKAHRVSYSRGETDVFNLGLENTYDYDKLERFDRQFEIDNNGTLTITDTFKLKENCFITEQFLVDSEKIPSQENGVIELINKGKKVIFNCNTDTAFTAEAISNEICASKLRTGLCMVKFGFKAKKGENIIKFIVSKA